MRLINWVTRQSGRRSQLLCLCLIVGFASTPTFAQDVDKQAITAASGTEELDASLPTLESLVSSEEQDTLQRLQSIGKLINAKRQQRDDLTSALTGSSPDSMQDERQRLNVVTQDLKALRGSFEKVLLDSVDTHLMATSDDAEFNWRSELVEVIEPLLISLKTLTKRPRQLAELRKNIELDKQKLMVTEQALVVIDRVPKEVLNDTAAFRLAATREKWVDARNLINESLMISQSQLGRLQSNERPLLESIIGAIQGFLVGRGLTLLIAAVAATLGWGLLRVCWYMFQTKLTRRSIRRKATWFRLLAYSFHLFTLVVVVSIVMSVLYIRQDVLLMGLGFVLLAVAVISLRTFLPRFLTEVRLLLNLGAVREEECVIHNGLPWQIMSLNILTVLRNPALEGVIRLPLNVMTDKVSRPTLRNELWFPTKQDDYILLPDNIFGRVVTQTPELIEVSVKGGMSMTIPTSEFYAMRVMNLSRNETFGIAVTFGLDYGLQSLSLTSIPETLKAGVLARLSEAGFRFGPDITNLIVELASAGASSLNFLIYTNASCTRAADYFTIERLVQQACVDVANKHEWLIPFPQLTLHHQPSTAEAPMSLQRAA